MKRILLIVCVLLGMLGKAQDSLFVDSLVIDLFDSLGGYVNGDTMRLTYYVSGAEGSAGYNGLVSTKMQVQSPVGTINGTEADVDTDNSSVPLDLQTQPSTPIYKSYRTISPYFKNGNNTVVIWPEASGLVSPDTAKFTMNFDAENGIYTMSFAKDFVITTSDGQMHCVNLKSEAQTIYVFNAAGQLIYTDVLAPNFSSTIQITTGLFIIKGPENNLGQKILVR